MKKSLSREGMYYCVQYSFCCVQLCASVIPNPDSIMCCVFSGSGAVWLSCGDAVWHPDMAHSMFFFSIDHSWIYFEPINRDKLIVVLLGLIANICVIGHFTAEK